MSTSYRPVQWSPYKQRYDLVVAGGIGVYLIVFIIAGKVALGGDHAVSDPILLLRALGTCAFGLLTLILCIGPLCRLDRRFLPLLYNRRHLGVATCAVATLHVLLVLVWYHGFGIVDPIKSLITGNRAYTSASAFPFEILGVFAFFILFAMAATSHDFWLKNLSPRWWKSLHMLVYIAWALLVMHIAVGAMQSERSVAYPAMLIVSVVLVAGLHVTAGRREVKRDRSGSVAMDTTEWVDACAVDDVREGRGKAVCIPGRGRIAVFRHQGRFSAMSNVCVHQGGPLGEGRIIDGCVTCPWHGYQYQPHNGQSPPPFTEKVPTYRLRIETGRVLIDPRPLAPGTPVEPVSVDAPQNSPKNDADPFFVGYLPTPPAQAKFTKRNVAGIGIAGVLIAALLAAAERDPGDAVWAIDEPITIEGTYIDLPYPMLLTADSAMPTLLVGEGKHRIPDYDGVLVGRRVRIHGTVLHRDAYRMIEVADDPAALVMIESTNPPNMPLVTAPEQVVSLEGEIIDPKCFLGAMKPGEGKTHKGCAILCLRGGIPPMFAVWAGGRTGPPDCFLLVDRSGGPIDGEALTAFLDFVGDPISVHGAVGSLGPLRTLTLDRNTLTR
ncbi:MAG: Rieske 2Fe-2S domain-containing protein [Planctomycetes bacterium]|nr:Rieske 2Fe-2S domain-containing protein [Planctomycetota bacterium]